MGPISVYQFEKIAAHCFRILRQSDAQQGGVARHARPVALEREQHAVLDAQRAEDAPARQEPHLSGRQHFVGAVADFVVV